MSSTLTLAAAALATSESLRMKGDFGGAARVLDEHLLALPERGEEGLTDVLLERARIALASGAIQEARLRLRELTAREGGTPGRWCTISGVLAALVADHAAALRHTWCGVVAFRATGAAELEARAWSNLAMVYVDQRRVEEAAGAIDYAFAIGPDPEQLSSSLAVRAELAFIADDLDAAEQLFTQAVQAAERVGARWSAGAAHSARAAVRGRAGALAGGEADLVAARRLLGGVPNRWTLAAVEVWAGMLDVAKGDVERARARLATAHRPVAEGLSLLDADLGGRAAARHLAAALGQPWVPGPPVGRPALRVPNDGSSVALGTSPATPIRAAAARRILAALALAAVHDPGRPVSAASLIATGWPGQVLLRESALNRLYVALHALRRAGLAAVLVTRRDGYLLDAETVQVGPAPEAL